MTNSKRGRPSRTDGAHANKKRPVRVPLSAGNKLHVPDSIKEEGYHYYWAIDTKGQIEQMEAAWYEKVTDERGDPMTVPAGNDSTHYLMRIEQKYHDEDIGRQQKLNIDATAKQAQKLGESEYVPLGSDNVATREII